jgi:hypothetical protein
MKFRRESSRTVFRILRSLIYRSYKSGDNSLIEWASVIADRDRCMKLGPQLAQPTGKKVGRPKKIPAPDPQRT